MRVSPSINLRLICLLLSCLLANSMAYQQAIAIPAQQSHEPMVMHPIPPQVPDDFSPPKGAKKSIVKSSFDPKQARADARQLSQMAQSVPGEVDQLSKNILPKDLALQLKQIQKLAKKLQSEIGK